MRHRPAVSSLLPSSPPTSSPVPRAVVACLFCALSAAFRCLHATSPAPAAFIQGHDGFVAPSGASSWLGQSTLCLLGARPLHHPDGELESFLVWKEEARGNLASTSPSGLSWYGLKPLALNKLSQLKSQLYVPIWVNCHPVISRVRIGFQFVRPCCTLLYGHCCDHAY